MQRKKNEKANFGQSANLQNRAPHRYQKTRTSITTAVLKIENKNEDLKTICHTHYAKIRKSVIIIAARAVLL